MENQDQPTGDSSGPILCEGSAGPAEPHERHGEDLKVRPVHFAHAHRNDPAPVPFLRKGQMEQWEVYALLGNSQDTGTFEWCRTSLYFFGGLPTSAHKCSVRRALY